MSPIDQEETQEVSLPSQEASPSIAKKDKKKKTPVRRTRKQKVIRRVIPIPSVLETILEEDEEDEENDLPLIQRTHLPRTMEEEQRRSSTIMLPSIPTQPIQVTTSDYELQQWIEEKENKGNDEFNMSYFDFMPVGTELVGDKIKDTPKNQPLEGDWSQSPPQPQGLQGSPQSPGQDLSLLIKV